MKLIIKDKYVWYFFPTFKVTIFKIYIFKILQKDFDANLNIILLYNLAYYFAYIPLIFLKYLITVYCMGFSVLLCVIIGVFISLYSGHETNAIVFEMNKNTKFVSSWISKYFFNKHKKNILFNLSF